MQVSALNQVMDQIQHLDPNQFPFSVFPSTVHPSSKGYDELRALRENGVNCYPQRALSYSSLKAFANSPMHYIEYVCSKYESSEAMIEGKVFEELLFDRDPEEFFVIWQRPLPEKDFRTKVNNEAKKQAIAEAAAQGKDPIELQDFQRIERIAKAALKHPFMQQVKRYKSRRNPGAKMIVEPETGLTLNGIADLEYNRGRVGVDIKFGYSPAEYGKRFFDRSFRMWMQAAMYGIIYGYEEFYFFVTQSKGSTPSGAKERSPSGAEGRSPSISEGYSHAFHIDAPTMEVLKEQMIDRVLRKFKKHLAIGFLEPAKEISVPNWML